MTSSEFNITKQTNFTYCDIVSFLTLTSSSLQASGNRPRGPGWRPPFSQLIIYKHYEI